MMAPESIQIAQLVAYVMLTLSSVTVAVVSLIFAYRQNFGWEPLALPTGHSLGGMGEDKQNYTATVSFEVWNRRKYPVVIRFIVVKFSVLEFDSLKQHSANWHVNGARKELTYRDRIVVEPSGQQHFEATAYFKRRTLDDLSDSYTIKVHLYDPRKNKSIILTAKGRYGFGEMVAL